MEISLPPLSLRTALELLFALLGVEGFDWVGGAAFVRAVFTCLPGGCMRFIEDISIYKTQASRINKNLLQNILR